MPSCRETPAEADATSCSCLFLAASSFFLLFSSSAWGTADPRELSPPDPARGRGQQDKPPAAPCPALLWTQGREWAPHTGSPSARPPRRREQRPARDQGWQGDPTRRAGCWALPSGGQAGWVLGSVPVRNSRELAVGLPSPPRHTALPAFTGKPRCLPLLSRAHWPCHQFSQTAAEALPGPPNSARQQSPPTALWAHPVSCGQRF